MMETVKAKANKTDEELKSEALNLFYEIQRHGLEPFEGASVDFHQKRELVVFIPGETPIIATVRHDEFLEFLLKNGVRRVLVDALFPARAETLSAISKAGIEVYFIRRTTIVETFRKYLRKKLKIEVPRKNDFTDAAIQLFIKPKFIQQTDWRYLDCWLEMQLWRDNSGDYQKYRQKLKTYPPEKRHKVAKLIAEIEKTAQDFVDTVVIHYPQVKEHFKRLGITDVITQAYYCEVYLEMIVCKSFAGVLKKAGIDVSQKAHLKKLEQRRQKEEQKDSKESKDTKEDTFIYDGRFRNALNQLTIKVRRLNLKKHKQRIPVETILLAKEIWLLLQNGENGRVGEALGWMSRAPSFRGGLSTVHPRLCAGGLRKQESPVIIRPRSKALNTRPTDNNRNYVLTHPLFHPLILTIYRVYGLRHISRYV
jgi:predicted nucleic acid-binding protein